MLLLTSTSDEIQVTTGSAGLVKIHASWMDHNAGTITPGRTNTAHINTATTTDVVASPGASTQRNIKNLSIYNDHATDPNLITVLHTDGTTVEPLAEVNLLAGESLVLHEDGRWTHYDIQGGAYSGLAQATQAEMEAASDTQKAVTPGRQHFHPGHPKFWVKAGLTGNILASYNVTSLSDTAVGAVTITIATDFSSVNWVCIATIELASTTVAQSCTYDTMTGGSVILRSVVEAGSNADPVTWSCAGIGDQ